jgi:hypothetical protein
VSVRIQVLFYSMYGHIYRTVGVIDGNQGIHVLGHTWSSKKSCEKGLTSVPTLGERFASVLLMLIIQRVQSSTEKEVSCPALVEKRGRAGCREDLPRFPRLWRTCRWVQALPESGV